MKTHMLGLIALALTPALWGCGDSDGGGPNILVDPREEPAGDNCSAGGTALARGIDANGNDMLDADEVSSLDFVCNGVSDGDGSAGGMDTDGDGAQLVSVRPLPEGDDDCLEGGISIVTGPDTDGDGMLDADEVQSMEVVCSEPPSAPTVVETRPLKVGDDNCPNGGVEVAQGPDENENGMLDDKEVKDVSFACNGEPGDSADPADSCTFPAEWDATAGGCVARGDWAGADLSDADLGSIYLAGTDFSGADLSGADLSWTELRGADFTGADLIGVDLSNASVDDADFSNAVLTGADLSGVDLRDATLDGVVANMLAGCPRRLPNGWECLDLGANGLTLIGPGATLNGLDLTGANLAGEDLGGVQAAGLLGCPATLPAGWQCLNLGAAGLTLVGRGADLSDLNLTGANFGPITDLRDVDFDGSNLTNAIFAGGTQLDDATFVGSNLSNVNLSTADLTGVRAYDVVTCPIGLPTDWSCAALPQTGNTLVGPDADLSGLNLTGSNLDGQVLDNADLDDANLTGASLVGADLTDADLDTANLVGADLTNAVLDNTNLDDADLTNATLDGADLTDASLQDVDLAGASLVGADLNNADLDGATLDGVTAADLQDCPNSLPGNWDCVADAGATFVLVGPGAALGGLGLDLTGSDLTNADLVGADLSGADLTSASLDGIDATGVDLSGTTLTGADLSDTDFSNADFSGSNLDDSDLNNADLGGADLAGVTATNLQNCPGGLPNDWDCIQDGSGNDLLIGPSADLGGVAVDLSGVNLSGQDFTGIDLTGGDLSGADVSSTVLSSATLVNVDLTNADLNDSDLGGADISGATLAGVTWDNTTCPSGVNSDDNGNSCP